MATTKVRYNQIKTGLPAGGDANYSDVSLLLHMNGTDGSTNFVDSSNAGHSVSVSGGAVISTDQSKFGGSSYEGDGSSSKYLSIASSDDFELDGDFTIEFWVYANSTTRNSGIISNGQTSWEAGATDIAGGSGTTSHYLRLENYPVGGSYSTVVIDNAAITNDTWIHYAFTRSGSTVRMFKNGTQVDSATHTDIFDFGYLGTVVGGTAWNSTPTTKWDGYIDELRVTKGVARYTSNFSVPTAAFPAFESKEGKELRVGANGTIELES